MRVITRILYSQRTQSSKGENGWLTDREKSRNRTGHESRSKSSLNASTLNPDLRKKLKFYGNRDAAIAVGELLAKNAAAAGIEQVAFDRSGYRYHGRVQAFADSAREHGLKF